MSFDIDSMTGSIRKSEQVAASLSKRLLFPMPQSPRIAKDAILPVVALWQSASENVSR